MYLLIRLLVYVTMVLTAPVIKYETARKCSDTVCENNSHCIETLILRTHVQPEQEARCVCHGHFTGPRCEAKLILTPDVVKAHFIGFKVLFQNVSNGNIISSDSLTRSLSYSIQYWKNVSERSCSISTDIHSQSHGLDGLEKGASFTICAVTDPGLMCFPRNVNLTTEKNCIIVRTKGVDEDSFLSQPFILPVAIAVIVVLCITILVILCLLKRKFLKSNTKTTNNNNQKRDWAKIRRKEKERDKIDINLVKESSLDDLLDDKYNTDENSIDRRISRQTGTSTFAPLLNRKSLPDLLEERDADLTESSRLHRPYSVSDA